MRIGHSWDIHRLVEGRKLILGGVEIPHEVGLLGHSDADCLLHSIAEALLGSLALGDLGAIFPDTDMANKDLDSSFILRKCYQMVLEKGYYICNIDSTIYAEKPKMRPFVDYIRKSISEILQLDIDKISVKATTHEKLGPIGEKKAIACETVVLVDKKSNLVLL